MVSKVFEETLQSHEDREMEFRIVRPDGATRWIRWRGQVVQDAGGRYSRIICVNMDVTEGKEVEEERRRLESRLFQSQKIESIGTLTGGIAHDFNNILSALMGYAALLQMKMEEKDPLRPFVDQIVSGSQKAAELTRSLLAFSRQQPITFFTLGVNDIVTGIEKLLRRLVTEDIAIKTILAPDQPIIRADATQIEQVLLNLATNARDAMPNGGALLIETRITELDDAFVRSHGYGEPGRYALIAVSDTGAGMDEATRQRVFDPFFTTKEVGKGTGLGLSTVYGIVKQHNGYITVYSEPNIGTTFHVYLPAADKIVEREKPAPVVQQVTGGVEVILIAEDNEAVRNLMRDVLTQYGYTIIEATDGADAVDKFRKTDHIDLLVLDSVMPKRNGRETYNEISSLAPDVKVLFISGYTRDVVLNKGIEDNRFPFLSKPIQAVALLNKVREVLDR
jgi:signal transduction histidine kinase